MPTIILVVISCCLMTLSAQDWTLVWQDEFDHDGLPDPAKWSYEEGFVRNHEAQYYTVKRPENCRVENGMLIIEGRKDRFPNPRHRAGSHSWKEQAAFAAYTAASLKTEHTASWLYGRIEVRAKLPQGKGMWPAIWTLGTNIRSVGWPACGEIDIMEFVGKEPDKVHANAHFARDGQHASKGGTLSTPSPFDEFHLYALEWDEQELRFFFDDQRYHTVRIDEVGPAGADNAFRKPQYLILNLAIGGSWGGAIDDSMLPQRFLVDYVRVYQRNKH